MIDFTEAPGRGRGGRMRIDIIIVTTLSVLVQAAGVILALKLIRVTGGRRAWIFIALGISGMAVRRIISLHHLVRARSFGAYDLSFEMLGLVTSVFMLLGIAWIGPVFRKVRDSEEALRRVGEERERLIDKLREAAANVKTLSGLLPICSSCKKIRDDNGYWNQLEGYIRDHSGAEFTHGLCPDCVKGLLSGRDP